MERISFEIVSRSHRINPEVFRALESPASQTKLLSVRDQSMEFAIEVPIDGGHDTSRLASFGLRIASDILVSLNVATCGFFHWARGAELHWEGMIMDSVGQEITCQLSPLAVQLFEDRREFTEENFKKFLVIMAAMHKEREAMFRSEYLKGLLHLTAGYGEIEFSREAFGNFYRGFEYFITSRVLKKNRLSNEVKEIKDGMRQLGLGEEFCSDFGGIYGVRSEQVMHAQKPQVEISADDILKIKVLFDYALHKYYLDTAIGSMQKIAAAHGE